MERLGIGREVLRAANPRVVYGALRGFGDPRTGATRYQQWPAFDVVAQAMGGIMTVTGPDAATPTKISPDIGDIVPGMMLGFGVLAAIHHAQRTGEGQFVDVAMTDALLAVCEQMVWQHSLGGAVPGPEGNHHPFLSPFGMFPAADGFVTVAAQADEFFRVLCTALDAPALAADHRFTTTRLRSVNRVALIEVLGAVTRGFAKVVSQFQTSP